jgi:hypothetical protein
MQGLNDRYRFLTIIVILISFFLAFHEVQLIGAYTCYYQRLLFAIAAFTGIAVVPEAPTRHGRDRISDPPSICDRNIERATFLQQQFAVRFSLMH